MLIAFELPCHSFYNQYIIKTQISSNKYRYVLLDIYCADITKIVLNIPKKRASVKYYPLEVDNILYTANK